MNDKRNKWVGGLVGGWVRYLGKLVVADRADLKLAQHLLGLLGERVVGVEGVGDVPARGEEEDFLAWWFGREVGGWMGGWDGRIGFIRSSVSE